MVPKSLLTAFLPRLENMNEVGPTGGFSFVFPTEAEYKYGPIALVPPERGDRYLRESDGPQRPIMKLLGIMVLGFSIQSGRLAEAAAITTPSSTAQQPQTTRVEKLQVNPSLPEMSTSSVRIQHLTSLAPISRITPPPSLNHLELRQRCWNDQGFFVDCAVWTGYRYTWGPATNPYDYWSGGAPASDGGLVFNSASTSRVISTGVSVVATAIALIIVSASVL